MFARVAVVHGGVRPEQTYTYTVPQALAPRVRPGQLVLVPFGPRYRRGWLLELSNVPPAYLDIKASTVDDEQAGAQPVAPTVVDPDNEAVDEHDLQQPYAPTDREPSVVTVVREAATATLDAPTMASPPLLRMASASPLSIPTGVELGMPGGPDCPPASGSQCPSGRDCLENSRHSGVRLLDGSDCTTRYRGYPAPSGRDSGRGILPPASGLPWDGEFPHVGIGGPSQSIHARGRLVGRPCPTGRDCSENNPNAAQSLSGSDCPPISGLTVPSVRGRSPDVHLSERPTAIAYRGLSSSGPDHGKGLASSMSGCQPMSVEADIADRPCECEKDDPPESLADAPATKKVERAGVTLKSIARILCETPVFTPSQLELAIHVAVRYRWPAGIWLSRLMPPGLLDRHGGVLEPAGASIDVAEIARRWPGAEPITAALRNGGSVSPELLATHLSADDQADFVEVAVSVGLATVVPGTLPPADAIWAELQRPAATTPPQSVSASELPATGKGGDVDAEILAPSAALDKNTRRTLSSLFADLTQQRAGVFLLHGEPPEVQLCLQLARCCKSLRRQVVIVLPDVRGVRRLTTALASLLPPGSVATYHSKLRIAERREVWRSMLCGRPNVIVGTQAALLAPLQRLGAIVVLDEHSHVYKSERMPRYHARDIALWLGRQRRATLLLVSPTPDPVTLWNARRGAYRYVDLSPHGGAAGMPGARVTAPGIAASGDAHTVEVLDLRQELRVANTSLISRRLHMELARALSQGERAVLLLNRRGAYTQQICARCGYVAQCFRCAMALTYHADEAALVCHYCNTSYVMNPDCPNCVNRRLQFVGAGTQRVEQELHQRFPSMRLARLDRDASKGPAADRAIVRRFAHGELDVLIGTRLLATPGLVPPTALVAVLNADVTLRLPDFQAAQETYELLYGIERCVEPGGRLLIQTYSPDHWVVQAIAAHDPAVYYREELRQRRTLGYPPFAQLVRLVRVHRDPTACRAQAEELAARLERRRVELRLDRAAVIGPAPAYFERLRGLSRWQLFLRGHGIAPLLDVIPRGWSIDVDPVTTL